MAEENEERLRTFYDAFSREDFEAAMEIAHPDIEFTRPDQGTIRGVDAVLAWARPDALESHTVTPLEFATKGDVVLVRQHHKARGSESGIDVEAEAWTMWTFDADGRVIG